MPVPEATKAGVESHASRPTPHLARAAPRAPDLRQQYLDSADLRTFVDGHLSRVGDPETAFYVSQALEECAVNVDVTRDERFSEAERSAAQTLAAHCRGFRDRPIEPAAIVNLLSYAASWGEPHAMARMLLFRDIAAPKDEVLAALPWILTSRDPSVVRDVGAFLSRGDAQWRYGDEQVPTAVAALAWDLAACDLDAACKPWSRFNLAQCAMLGRCAAGRYEDALAVLEPPELLSQAKQLREGILRALREHDWAWLGLG